MLITRGNIVWLKPKAENIEKFGDNVQDILGRPFVVISNDINNKFSPTVQLASITKQVKKANYPMHVYLKKELYNSLSYNSIVLLEQVITINKEFIDKVTNHLCPKDIMSLNKAVIIQMIGKDINIAEVV